nr:uncharacterized protein LOC123759114 isoform X2 [Procambarus clarkii]XP_045599936.1 uncharacterized protein LOC123759114 isoform X2 [Procambarus clarkii]XP_045599937.1 uncharacterized protein LOC123759114 isoform X2 [Procambarus clarkii]
MMAAVDTMAGVSACPALAGGLLQLSTCVDQEYLREQCPHRVTLRDGDPRLSALPDGDPHLPILSSGNSHLPTSSARDPHLSTSLISGSAPEVVVRSSVLPSPRLTQLLEGISYPGVSDNPPQPPPWLDREMFNRGRKFYQRYLYCLCFTDLLSLVMTLSAERALKPLIYTGRSDTPIKALRRYFSTLLHLITWFTGDVWEPSHPAHKDILAIRSIHCKLAQTFNNSACNEKLSTISVAKKGHEEPADSLNSAIRQDLQRVAEDTLPTETSDGPVVYINQLDMSLTQYAFMGLVVAHPEKLGTGSATEEEMAGLIHFWRGLGWLMGIEDQYNFCSGTVAETKALCLEVERLIFIPLLAKVDWNYEHMATSLIKGMSYIVPATSYPAMFRYLAYTLDIAVPTFVSKMSYRHSFHYWVMRCTFALILLVPCLLLLLNYMFNSLIDKLQKDNSKFKLTMSGGSKSVATPSDH